jgi:hypothetical protein
VSSAKRGQFPKDCWRAASPGAAEVSPSVLELGFWWYSMACYKGTHFLRDQWDVLMYFQFGEIEINIDFGSKLKYPTELRIRDWLKA